jgi:hypothetical protein
MSVQKENAELQQIELDYSGPLPQNSSGLVVATFAGF